ncbi:CHASE3 domain-containing protein [Ramlibacter sp. MMS24-I3-19]|uniref:CHASE3 domain-containing protein n=1 Tax=Ramlibacter sp. MMS24-I3-19 TaxID=3416606 RepID=UPI003D0069D7
MRASSVPRLAIGLALALLAALALIGINEVGHRRSIAALDSMAREAAMRSGLDWLLQNVLDAETASRGFLLTGETRYLAPYQAATSNVDRAIEQMGPAWSDATEDAPVLRQLGQDVRSLLAQMDHSVQLRRTGHADARQELQLTDAGKDTMDAIRAEATRLIQGATARMDRSRKQVRRTLMLARVGIAATTLVALLASWLYLRKSSALARAGEEQQRALQQERDLLERQVRERTASLAELATHLQQVREDERGHLARELHDELGALLTAAKLDVARLKSRLGPQQSEVAQRLQHLTDTLNSGIALKRRIIEDLRPSSLANLGLTASLEILAREFSERSGVQVATDLEPVRLDEAHQLTVYRVVQESLTNMAKYADAQKAEVAVHANGGHVEVVVSDNGKGFEPVHSRPTSHGLAGMRHRVEAAGGRLTVESAPGKGTRVVAALPALATPA